MAAGGLGLFLFLADLVLRSWPRKTVRAVNGCPTLPPCVKIV